MKLLLIPITFTLIRSSLAATGRQQVPLTEEELIIIQKELEWAEEAMESYKQKFGRFPLRSTIRAAHVHTDDWRQDSTNALFGSYSSYLDSDLTAVSSKRNLRG